MPGGGCHVYGRGGVVDGRKAGERGLRAWPPPALRSAAAVLTATRCRSVNRMLLAFGSGLSTGRLAERGARGETSGEGSAASQPQGAAKGGLGFPGRRTGKQTFQGGRGPPS